MKRILKLPAISVALTGGTRDVPKSPNPESWLNDEPPPQEKVSAPNTAPK
jgi:hypothetical protein